ncbi:3-hydroxyanthranilic acid dioxygenase [Penicillium verhagenii]|uniref:3-hydroxyanthranilic acid dioxygenase n=1 Tax=Penicillium verhagenii TaxID=1562060 RepID=UPI002544EF45|nr:3-hydroxyanthranilic acid dioxygenase [Penicillium verhagenii]KAJ5924614.1 3-hydroxyanthranilic acid dioxygenase [Penicillium verhagenii]
MSTLPPTMAIETHSSTQASIPGPFSLSSWISMNADKLKPPVNNSCLYSGKDFILMAVGGPNTRNDYHSKYLQCTGEFLHVNETEEWFFQVKGDMLLKIVENQTHFRDIIIQEGETFLLPANVPHSPRRYKDTVGLVMERTRPLRSMDRIRWYCENADAHGETPEVIREEQFYCEDIETQLKDVIEDWMENAESRKCSSCGQIAPAH